jgi:thiamine kinase-like enzyme
MTVHSASLNISDNTITKRYKKNNDKAFIKFIKELSVYQAATKNNLKYIPKLIDYDFKKRTITIEKIPGYDLSTIPEKDYEKRESYLPLINKVLKSLKKDLNLYHNDILYRNFIYNPKNKRLYIIDFESASIEKTSHEPKDYIEINIKKKLKSKKTKKKKK